MIVEEANLKIRGAVSKHLLGRYHRLVNYRESTHDVVLFCDYSSFDIPLGYTFNRIEDLKNGNKVYSKIILKGVSQEFGISFDLIPKGYKTICNFQFIESDVPEIIDNLPLIADWYESENILLFT